MPTHKQKTSYLKKLLKTKTNPYHNEIKADIYSFIWENESNEAFQFLEKLETLKAVKNWVDTLVSLIVLKLDEEVETVEDFIHDQICYTQQSDSSAWNKKKYFQLKVSSKSCS